MKAISIAAFTRLLGGCSSQNSADADRQILWVLTGMRLLEHCFATLQHCGE